jgi:hypothetical protein
MFNSSEKPRAHLPTGPATRQRTRPRVEQLEERTLPSVYTPAQIRAAYGFNQVSFGSVSGDGTGQTIAIVDAYNDPNLAGDLNTFDQTFSINGTQSLYQQYGDSSSFLTVATPQGLPATDTGWSLEIALDVEWAHAIAPGAKILLVEAGSSSFSSLLSAVRYAAGQPGVSVVSMSWGSSEFSSETSFDSTFTTPAGHPGVTFVASSGDSGSPPSYPAASPNVLSVGGTSLNLDASGNYLSETAWGGSTGGLSAFEGEPGYQRSVQSSGVRSNPDMAYNGDPYTGYYVYDSVGYGGWLQVGGTSAGAPQWAALVAIADQGRARSGKGSLDGPTQTLPAIYSLSSSDFHDITSGSNGGYSAGPGYDNVTGRGSPYANLVIGGLVAYGSTTGTEGGGTSGTGTGSSGGGGRHRHPTHHADLVAGPSGAPAPGIAGDVATAPLPGTGGQARFLAKPTAGDAAVPPARGAAPGETETTAAGLLPAVSSGNAGGPGGAVILVAPVGGTQTASGGQLGDVRAESDTGPDATDLVSQPAQDNAGLSLPPVPVPGPVALAGPLRDTRPATPADLAALFAADGPSRRGRAAGKAPLPAGDRAGTAPADAAIPAALGVVLARYWDFSRAADLPRRRARTRPARP